MRFPIMCALILAPLCCGSSALADSGDAMTATTAALPSHSDTASAAPNYAHTIVCRAYDAETGSRIGGRVICLTRQHWDQINRDASNAIEHYQDNAALNPGH